ncbi:MAG: hypothetical protein ACREFK_04455 [Stellaceae bacterium]
MSEREGASAPAAPESVRPAALVTIQPENPPLFRLYPRTLPRIADNSVSRRPQFATG